MRIVQAVCVVTLIASVAGCSGLPQSQRSYVEPSLTPETTQFLASDMASKAAGVVRPSQTQLVIAPTNDAQAALGKIVSDAFRKKGYAVQELVPPKSGEKMTTQRGARLRYQITADPASVFARMDLPRNMLTRGYGYRDDATLAATGPWSNMELSQ